MLGKCSPILLWRVPYKVFLYYFGGLELLLFTACLNLIFLAWNSYAVLSQNSEQYFIRFLGWLYGLVKSLTTEHFPKARSFIRESLQGIEMLIPRTLKLLKLFFSLVRKKEVSTGLFLYFFMSLIAYHMANEVSCRLTVLVGSMKWIWGKGVCV